MDFLIEGLDELSLCATEINAVAHEAVNFNQSGFRSSRFRAEVRSVDAEGGGGVASGRSSGQAGKWVFGRSDRRAVMLG